MSAPGAFWSGRTVLVTGANGFVGSRLVEALLARGAQVVALVRDAKPGGLEAFGLADRVVTIVASVTDDAAVRQAIRRHGVTFCFHLAAQALVGAAAASPTETLDINVRGTWTVLEACRTEGVEGVIVASSDKAYGPSPQIPNVETHPLSPLRPYEASKACLDIIARMFHGAYGLPVAVTRCANIFGGGDLNSSRLVPDVVGAALNGDRPVLRSDGTMVRDFLYISDAVEGNLVLAERLNEPGVAGQAFNFGSGEPRSVLEVVRRILQLAGRPDLEPVIASRVRPGDEIPAQYADSSKAERLLGWRPATDFDSALEMTIAWYREHRDRQRQRALAAPAAEAV